MVCWLLDLSTRKKEERERDDGGQGEKDGREERKKEGEKREATFLRVGGPLKKNTGEKDEGRRDRSTLPMTTYFFV